MPLTPIPADRVRELWEHVRPQIDAARMRGREAWLTEDVYRALLNGTAWLHLAVTEDGRSVGLIVTERRVEWGRASLHIWIGFHRDIDRTIADWWPDVLALARAGGFSRVTLDGRRGYDRALPNTRLLRCQYECEVAP